MTGALEQLPRLTRASLLDPEATGYPWPDGPWLRASMVMSLDGQHWGWDGRSKSLSGDSDRLVLAALRSWADAVLVGAATVRAERYRPLRVRPELAIARRRAGRAIAPRLVIVTRSLDLDLADPLFSRSLVQPLLVAPQDAPEQAVARARGVAPVVLVPPERGQLPAPAILSALHERGLRHLLCEGGPTLLGQVSAAGLLDELDLTVSPVLVGTAAGRPPSPADRADPSISAARVAGVPLALALAATRSQDGFLFTRYIRSAPHAEPYRT